MILLVSEIKKFLRKYLPNKLYFLIYKIFKKVRRTPQTAKLEKQTFFTKRGKYVFVLDDIKFDMVLDPDNGGVDSEIYADGVYEPEILTIIKDSLKSESIFVDIGANIGQHSLFASRFAKKVYSFEPIGKIYQQFMESISLNGFDNIQVQNYALGNQEITLPIYGNANNMGASSVVSTENRKKIQDIEVKRFDDVSEALGIERVNFIKIDVEGYEFDVLLGAKQSIQKFHPILLIEFSPYFYKQIDITISNKIIEFLEQNNYVIYDIGDGIRDRKVITSKTDISMIEQTNFICVYGEN